MNPAPLSGLEHDLVDPERRHAERAAQRQEPLSMVWIQPRPRDLTLHLAHLLRPAPVLLCELLASSAEKTEKRSKPAADRGSCCISRPRVEKDAKAWSPLLVCDVSRGGGRS